MIKKEFDNILLSFGVTKYDEYFVLSLFFLNLFNLVSNLQDKFKGIPSIFKYALIFFVLILLISKYAADPSVNQYIGFDSLVYKAFVFRTVLMLLFSLELNAFYFQSIFVNTLFFMPFFLPIIILSTHFSVFSIKYLLHFSFLLSLLGLIVKTFMIAYGIQADLSFIQLNIMGSTSIASGILLMCSHLYINKNVMRISIVNMIINIVILALLGRRGGVVSYVYIMLLFLTISFQSRVVLSHQKKMYLAIFVLLIGLFLISYSYLENNVYAFQRGFNSEGWNESRGDVIDNFFKDFTAHNDWTFGRGLNGEVLRFSNDTKKVAGIENGFLTVILKGGLFYLIAMLLLFIKAIYMGFFKTNNDLTKAFAANIFIHVLSMFSFGIPETTSDYVLVFVSVSICFSKKIRSLSNLNVIKILNY